jgi:hypothetical protein
MTIGGAMSDSSKRQRPPDPIKRGEAAWRAARDEIARRNDEASRRARKRREAQYEEERARRVAVERLERAELAKRRP